MARCSFCGRHSSDVQRMIAGPGAAYICDDCLQLCTTILHDPTPFSALALEMASRPPIVVPAPQVADHTQEHRQSQQEPQRIRNIEIEQKQHGMTLILHQLVYYQTHFELHYLWIRPPFIAGFAFVPRIIFLLKDDAGQQWAGERGGMLLARQDLMNDSTHAIYQGNARFRPLPSQEAHNLTIQAVDPLGQFEDAAAHMWNFEITI